jgi:hypothetical protein
MTRTGRNPAASSAKPPRFGPSGRKTMFEPGPTRLSTDLITPQPAATQE